jgi:hypothetical protein
VAVSVRDFFGELTRTPSGRSSWQPFLTIRAVSSTIVATATAPAEVDWDKRCSVFRHTSIQTRGKHAARHLATVARAVRRRNTPPSLLRHLRPSLP